MLEALQGFPYFIKFLRSKEPETVRLRGSMGAVLARRIASRAGAWEANLNTGGRRWTRPVEGYPLNSTFECAQGCLHLLSTLLCYESPAQIAALARESEITQTLVPILRTWAARYSPGCKFGKAAMRCERTLALNPIALELERDMRKRNKVGEGLQCAFPTCDREENLKKCSKCETAKYCSTEHQRAHWSLHKQMVPSHTHNFPLGAENYNACDYPFILRRTT
ncbi:hypothetical protein AURDEDRAFT_138760 [Auricularia subglabra TFB-10046 SS5]|nr:hypothetical protein AURDEDRAFT_138760 [Auricularia subglabra TFB-10046 SS5]